MQSLRIPLLGSPFIRNTSRRFIGFGAILIHFFPFMKTVVDQAGIKDEYNINAREYLAFCFFVGSIAFFGMGGLLYAILVAGKAKLTLLGPVIGAVMGACAFFALLMYPRSIINSRVKDLERNLLFSLRSMLIQIRSGVPIFNAIASIAMGNYGAIADEFKIVIEKVNSGRSVVEVLEEMAMRNPSIYFRRALWQVVNSLKSGSDLGKNLEDVIRSLAKEQLVEINRYKSILNPLSMMYMMVAVIAPSLGITMMIILSFFPGMDSLANENIFWGMMVGIVFMQFIFLGIIKSRRPNLIGN